MVRGGEGEGEGGLNEELRRDIKKGKKDGSGGD